MNNFGKEKNKRNWISSEKWKNQKKIRYIEIIIISFNEIDIDTVDLTESFAISLERVLKWEKMKFTRSVKRTEENATLWYAFRKWICCQCFFKKKNMYISHRIESNQSENVFYSFFLRPFFLIPLGSLSFVQWSEPVTLYSKYLNLCVCPSGEDECIKANSHHIITYHVFWFWFCILFLFLLVNFPLQIPVWKSSSTFNLRNTKTTTTTKPHSHTNSNLIQNHVKYYLFEPYNFSFIHFIYL